MRIKLTLAPTVPFAKGCALPFKLVKSIKRLGDDRVRRINQRFGEALQPLESGSLNGNFWHRILQC